jgi:hypothetical protein
MYVESKYTSSRLLSNSRTYPSSLYRSTQPECGLCAGGFRDRGVIIHKFPAFPNLRFLKYATDTSECPEFIRQAAQKTKPGPYRIPGMLSR